MPRVVGLVSAAALIAAAAVAAAPASPEISGVVESHIALVHRTYRLALDDAGRLAAGIESFLSDPRDATLNEARRLWRDARASYGVTEAYRFCGGPIDFVDSRGGSGPELRLNAWPVDEAYLDYVDGDPASGLVNDLSVEITRESITTRNTAADETYVTTGYHALEFLLWGQDLDLRGPGRRPAEDYAPGDPVRERRRELLRVVSALLIADLTELVDAWAPDRPNYAAKFRAMPPIAAVEKILTGIAELSRFELAMERLALPLDSGDQEDEHSCFSDTTHADVRHNVRGIRNVYYGRADASRDGVGVHHYLASIDPELDGMIVRRLDEIERAAGKLDAPFDRTLRDPEGSRRRARVENLVGNLQLLGDLLDVARVRISTDAP